MSETEVQNPDINKYELMVIIDPDLGSSGIKKRLDKVKKLVSEHKGNIYYEDIWGLRDLAYEMKKRAEGYFAVLDFEGESEILKEIDGILKLDNEVLRHMIMKLPFNYETRSFAVLEEETQAVVEEKPKGRSVKKEEPVLEKPKEEPKEELKKEVAEKPETAEKSKTEKPETKKSAEEEKKEADEKKETTLKEVDEKLKTILDNPDYKF